MAKRTGTEYPPHVGRVELSPESTEVLRDIVNVQEQTQWALRDLTRTLYEFIHKDDPPPPPPQPRQPHWLEKAVAPYVNHHGVFGALPYSPPPNPEMIADAISRMETLAPATTIPFEPKPAEEKPTLRARLQQLREQIAAIETELEVKE